MLRISEIFIYPIKSLGGISVQQARVTDRGLQYDRRWMLVNENGVFLSQREIPKMALLQVAIKPAGLTVSHKHNLSLSLDIPFEWNSGETKPVIIWEDSCLACVADGQINNWFSDLLGLNCRLVYMPDDSHREVDSNYAKEKELTSFSDAFPMLLIGQPSLDDLNERLQSPVPMNRFRPNLVFTGGLPYEEDEMGGFEINNMRFACVKPCARCIITTINQDTAEAGKDPLRTLATYRSQNNKVLFGQNLLHNGYGVITVGDKLIRY
ncbi:MOSC domain-containing protein [Flavihumibacter profundi]|uniref:MOSC domain-containing protein n=1 Tax=Flavihumibacter profundi TaxID=2716883 RepID=UPI001CC4AEA0|nr:MOSC N-terminal beta barrel domain-containing protein [Flavihumibacter profundi]MBZ5857369.1 MOSC N-terminal beta barrel domain-containing protein [Flavihumibacter profundi]